MNVKLLVAGAGLLSAALAFGDDFIVNAPTTLSSTADYRNAAIHANLTVNSAASVAVTGDVVTVGSEVGETPVISISGKASLLTQYLKAGGQGGNSAHWLWPATEIGANGGTARFVVSDSANLNHTSVNNPATNYRPTTGLGLWLGGVRVSANAAVNNVEDDTIDLLELNKDGYADIACLTNDNAKTVRILFNGGKLRMHYAGMRGSIVNYCPSGKTVEYKSIDKNDIYLYKCYYGPRLIYGGGLLKTSGDGDVVIFELGYTEGSNKVKLPIYCDADGRIEWGHKGDLRLEQGGILQPRNDDVLPFGAGTGIVSLKGTDEHIYPEIDLYGTSQKVNGLVTTGAAFVSNRVATAATLVLGDSDYVGGRLSARIFGTVKVAVRGENANVTIDGTTAPELSVEEGTATVNGDTAIDSVTVADGSLLVVDGAVLTCSVLKASAGSVQCRNGGKIVLKVSSSDQTRSWVDFPADVTVVEKCGLGEYVYYGAGALTSPLAVREGRFTFSGCGYVTNEWWRFTVTASFGGDVVEIGELCFFDWAMAGTARMTNPSYNEYNMSPASASVKYVRGSDATLMENSSVMVPEGTDYDWKTGGTGRVYGDPTALFDRGGVNKMFSPKTKLPKAQTASYPITVRLAKNMKIGYFSYYNYPGAGLYQMPKGWRLETSPDGVSWTTAATFYDNTVVPTADMLSASGFANRGNVFRFEQLTMDQAAGISPTALVSVAPNATLDLDYTPDAKAEIGNLEYDLASGGGTITKFIPAETGNLNLVGAKPAYGDLTLGYVFNEVKNAANVANWTVSLNGVPMELYSAEIIGGKLVVHVRPKGLLLLLK